MQVLGLFHQDNDADLLDYESEEEEEAAAPKPRPSLSPSFKSPQPAGGRTNTHLRFRKGKSPKVVTPKSATKKVWVASAEYAVSGAVGDAQMTPMSVTLWSEWGGASGYDGEGDEWDDAEWEAWEAQAEAAAEKLSEQQPTMNTHTRFNTHIRFPSSPDASADTRTRSDAMQLDEISAAEAEIAQSDLTASAQKPLLGFLQGLRQRQNGGSEAVSYTHLTLPTIYPV